MSKIFFSGLNGSRLICRNENKDHINLKAVDQFITLPSEDITNIEIGWDYLLIWKNDKLYLSGKYTDNCQDKSPDKLITMPDNTSIRFKQAIAGSEFVTVLTDNNTIWLYHIHENKWNDVPNFISTTENSEKEYIIKIVQGRCTVALTNLGNAYSIPELLIKPETVRFVDAACGWDHTVLLTSDGEIYSTGMGTRGQMGHGDLEDCDEPKLINALAGLKVVQISAGGWHSTAVTSEGDIYTWGWNSHGQLGVSGAENVIAVPTVVDFTDENQDLIELNIVKAYCGSEFTICQTDSGDLWGCGSNKYGQLGMSRKDFPCLKNFKKLKLDCVDGLIVDYKCREWGTCIFTK